MIIVNFFWFGVELYSCLCWWVQLWGAAGEQCLRDPCRAEDYQTGKNTCSEHWYEKIHKCTCLYAFLVWYLFFLEVCGTEYRTVVMAACQET